MAFTRLSWPLLASCEHGQYDATAEPDRQIVERVAEIAQKQGVSRVQIALAWLLQKTPVTAPIVGATKLSHLDDAVGALSVTLTPDEVAYLEAPYVPHRVVGALWKQVDRCARGRERRVRAGQQRDRSRSYG